MIERTLELLSIEEIRENKIKKIDNPKDKVLNEFNLEDISMPEPPIVDLPSLNEVVDCDSLLAELSKIKDLPYNIKLLIIQKWEEVKYLAQLIFYNTVNKIIQLKDFIKQLWQQLKDAVKEIIKEIYDLYKDIIAYFKGKWKKLMSLFKKMKKSASPEEKEELKKQILSYGDKVLEMLGIYELWQTLQDLWVMLKNLWGVAKEGWNNMINSFKSLGEVLKDKDTPLIAKIAGWINLLLPILAALALAVLAAVEMSKKKQKANEKTLEEALEDIEKPNDISDLSLLLKDARVTQEKIDNEEEIIINEDSSTISICPILTPDTSLSEEDYGGYAIEIGLDYSTFSFNKEINEEIKLNDIIGYVENTPIKSKIEGKVIEKKNRYILVKTNDVEDIKEIEPQEDETINSIIKAFENIGYIEDTLKNDVLYTYKTVIYRNTIYDFNSITNANNSYNEIINDFTKETKKLEDNIKSICNKDNINKKLEKENGLLEIKDEIMDLKSKYFSYIIDTLNDKNKTLYSNEEVDYKLLDYYYEFILNTNYNDKNPYNIKLFDIINSFIQDRKKLEKLNRDIKEDINNIALKIDKNKKNFFEYNIEKEIGKLNLNNINDTYEYLKKLFGIKNVESKEIKIDSDNINSDTINEITNSNTEALSEEDMKNINNDMLVKKIAVLLYVWHNYKNNTNNEKTLKEQTIYEFDTLINFYNKISEEYKKNNDIINNIDSYKEASWPCAGTIYIDNLEYKHYLFINNKENNDVSEEEGNNQVSTKTKYEQTTYQYWLKYCGMATLVNCMLPMYWGTGFLVSGVPMPMPIILIPIHVVSGSCTCVIGLSICGIWIDAMMIFSNMSANMSSFILPINMVIEMTNTMLDNIKRKTTSKTLKEIGEVQIKVYDNLIRDTEKEIEDIKKEMDILKSM